MFKNLILYQLGEGWPDSADALDAALQAETFAPCAATQPKATGWVPPRGHEHGALVEVVDGQWIARLAIETKTVPGDAVRQKVAEEAARIEQTQGRTPGKKELRDMRDDALLALLPQAFARRSHITVWIHPQRRWLALDAGSQGKADEVITSLVRVAGQGFGIALLSTATSPQAAMTAWLADATGDALPQSLHIGRECELKASGDEPAVVRFTRHPLQTEQVRQHIEEGKLPTRLALEWQGRVAFTLTQSLQLKKISFMEGVMDEQPAAEGDDRFDADVALATGELGALLPELVDALGGAARPGMSESPAPAPTASTTPVANADDQGAPF